MDEGKARQTRRRPSVTVARNTPRRDLTDTETPVDMRRMRAYRLKRVREQLAKQDYSACVLFDPINIRYATGARNMSVWTLHNAARYCFIPAEGPVVLFDFHNSSHLSGTLETINEVRPTIVWFYFSSGPQCEARAGKWAAEIADLADKLAAAQTADAGQYADATVADFMRRHNHLLIHHALEQAQKQGRPPVARLDPDRPDKKTQAVARQMKRRLR